MLDIDRGAELVIFAPSTRGGLAEHTRYQATALANQGVNVHVLTADSAEVCTDVSYQAVRCLSEAPKSRTRLGRMVKGIYRIRKNLQIAAAYCEANKSPVLFLESFFEYGSPFWVHCLNRLKRSGTKIGANLHDPVRDYRVGPAWFHRLSIRTAYQPLSFVLAHQPVPPEALIPKGIEVSVVPVGVYWGSHRKLERDDARAQLGIPSDHRVFLSLGFIRDNKNLDLAIRALADIPDAMLIIAGRGQSSKDRPVGFYRDLARQLGVSERVIFDEEFIPEERIAAYMSACDVALLTYSQSFRSQSGVLNVAANYQTQVLASAGPSPLIECVSKFSLGQCIEPDDAAALAAAMKNWQNQKNPDWDSYKRFASWETNVQPICNIVERVGNRDE